VDIVSSRLSYSCGCGMVGVLIDCALELLQKVVNLKEVALRPQVWKRQRVIVHGRVRSVSHHCAAVSVALHASLIPANNRKLDSLQTHEPLTYVGIGGWVNRTALGIAKKLIEGVVRCSLSNLV
jgi:hypothetical protein